MARAKSKKPYYLYCRDAVEWTVEDEMAYDFTKLLGHTIYYLSRDPIEDAEEVTDTPVELEGWLTAYETQIVAQDNAKKAKRAAKSLEKTFKEELDKALQAMREEAEKEKVGDTT